MAKVAFEGGAELDEALAEFAKPTIAKGVGRRALKKAAAPILAAWQAGTKVLTGHLEASEVAGTKLNPRQRRLNRNADERSLVEMYVGTADPAGIQEEFGNVHQRAHPSLRPAWDAEGGDKAVDRIAKELAADIEKTRARLARKAAKLAAANGG